MAREIELTKGQVALVDDEDYEWASQFKWYASRHYSTYYAKRDMNLPERKILYLHREIMKPPPGMKVDHIDHDGLNCTRANLRIASNAENVRNSRRKANNTSGYKGVHVDKGSGKWQAGIKVNGKQIYLGSFADIIDAARAYDEAARKYHGEFANTNFALEVAQ